MEAMHISGSTPPCAFCGYPDAPFHLIFTDVPRWRVVRACCVCRKLDLRRCVDLLAAREEKEPAKT